MDHGGLPGDVPDLLSGIVALHRHRHRLACSSFLPFVFAAIPPPIRVRLGCVGKSPGSGDNYSTAGANDRPGLADYADSRNDPASPAKSAGLTGAFALWATAVTATTNMKSLANEKCAEMYSRNIVTHAHASESRSCRRAPRFAFIFCASAAFLLLRWVDPVVAGKWLPFHTSCGAITGLPCIFCGMTRGLHLLLNGDFTRALYFNWLAFPFLALIIFFIALFGLEITKRRVIVNLSMVLPVTLRRLTVTGLFLLLLWTSQAYLAVSHHKHELLNPKGPLYVLFVR